nr:hypothetical protein [Tanacetum cinerariifolium]
ASLHLNVGSKEGQDAEDDEDELYRDVNINLEGRDVQMTDVHTIQEFKDTHVTLTPVNPDGQQQSSSVSSQFVTSMLNPSPDAGIDSLFETPPQIDVPTSTTVVSFTLTELNLPYPTILISSQVQQVPTPPTTAPSTLLIVQRYMDQQINEAVKVAVQIQSDRLRDKAQAENEEFLKNLNENIQKIIKEQVKEQVKKIESNKSIHRSDEQRNIYKALVEAYESEKIILDTYRDTIMLKRRRDDVDKDEEPSAGSDRGSKRRREGKEPGLTSALKEKATKTTGKSTQGSKSQQKTASKSTPSEEPMQTTQDLEKPSHQEFKTATHESIQPWISDLVKQADSCSSFNELMDTPVDFLAFLMNRLKVDTLTPELLAGPTYKLMKGSCKSLVELKIFLEEVDKATTDQESARDVYSKRRINVVTELQIVEWHNYKHLDWMTVRRDDDKLYKFKEGDFKSDGTLNDVRTAMDDRLKEEETKDEESFDPIVQTPENSDDEGNDDASLGLNVGSEEGQDAEDDEDELYRDVNINLEGRDMDVPTLTTVVSFTLTAPTLPPPTIPTSLKVQQAPTPPTTAPSTLLQDLLNFGSLFGFDHRLKTLEANFSEFVQTNQFAGAVSFILGIVQRYMDQRINKVVKVAIQIQSDRLRDEA